MSALATTSPIVRGVRMLVAPVNRESGVPLVFDPAVQGRFDSTAVPEGWFDLGTISGLEEKAETAFTEVWSGAPGIVKTRAKSKISAGLRCTLAGWSRLAMMLSSGSGCMNLLRTGSGGSHADSGGTAEPAVSVLAGCTASVLQLPIGAAVNAGDMVVVDEDYTGQTGYIGSGIATAYVASAESVAQSADYVRRVSCNVAAASAVKKSSSGVQVTLASPLLAGVPSATMKVAVVQGFLERIGDSFVSEWSALLVMDGVQGDRILVHYPRLQSAGRTPVDRTELAAGLQRLRLQAEFHALPITDPNDGEAVLCYRSYLPAPGRQP